MRTQEEKPECEYHFKYAFFMYYPTLMHIEKEGQVLPTTFKW